MNRDRHVHLLLVEDTQIIQNVMKILLTNLGCAVDVAADGETALQLVQQHHYDLIFMDIGLPGMDGFATTRAIRQVKGYEFSIPIIALTAHLDDSQKHLCFESGMNEFLNKPINKDEAETILNRFIH